MKEKISDGRILDLIRAWLKADVMAGAQRWTPTMGAPQGAVISPLLANVYLHPLDARMAQLGYRMVRYADDFVVLCQSREAADAALAEIRRWVDDNGLSLHPDKTHVGDCRQPGEGFDFLGYRFGSRPTDGPGEEPDTLQGRHSGRDGRSRGDSLARIVADLNPKLRGWFGYFKHAHPWVFSSLDGFIRRRLRAILRVPRQAPGLRRNLRDHADWPNAFFADAGLFALHTAWRTARHSR